MAEPIEYEQGSPDSPRSSGHGPPASSGLYLFPDPDDSVAPAAVEISTYSAYDDETPEVGNDDIDEPSANTLSSTYQGDPNQVTTTNSTNADASQVGGLRGPNDDIRRFTSMTRAATSSEPGYEVGDGLGVMLATGSSAPISSDAGSGAGGGGNGTCGGDGGNGGNGVNDDNGRAGRGPKRTLSALQDPFEASMGDYDREAGEQPPEPDSRPDPYAVTPEVRRLESRPTAPAGSSSALPSPMENSTRPTPRKRKPVDDTTARPRLGQPGFSVEQYINHFDGTRLDAYRYSRLRAGVEDALKLTFTAGRRERTVDSRYGCWDSRRRHLGSSVHRWQTPAGFDILWYRTPEERAYFTRQAPFLQRILNGEEPIARWFYLYRADLMGPRTRIDAWRRAYRWVWNYDYEVRRRNGDGRDTDAQGNPDPGYFVGWHNTELFGLAKRERPGLYALTPRDWDEDVEGERLFGAPAPWTALHYGGYLTQCEFRTGVNFDNTDPSRVRLLAQFRRWLRMDGSYLFFAR